MSQSGSYFSSSGSGTVTTATGNSGGAVSPDALGDIQFLGSGLITVVGTPASNLLTISSSGGAITDHAVQIGNATGGLSSIAVGATGEVLIGNTGSDASWSASPVLTSILATTFDTNVAAAGVTLAGTSLIADGTDADIDINITAKGTGTVIVDELTLATDLAVTEGGTGASTLTDHGILLGSGTGAVTPTVVGASGELLIGNSAADPSWLIAGTADYVLTSHGAGSLPTWEANASTGVDSLSGDTGGPLTGALSIVGGTNITTVASGSNVTANLDSSITLTTVNATTFDTNVAAAGVTLAGTSVLADGTDADIDINITAKGTGQVIIDDLQLTTDLAVTEGGTGVSTLTDHGILLGSGTGAVTPTAVGASGEILIGATAADPTWLAEGTDGYVLTANPTGVAPSWQAVGTPGSVTSIAGDSGGASAGSIILAGGTNITSISDGSATVTANLDAAITLTTVNATTFDTNVAAAGVTLAGTTLLADGTDADINVNITAKGTGQVIIDDLQLTTDLAVTEGGTGASTLTDHGILLGSGTGAVTPTAVGASGELLIGATAADPTWLAEGTDGYVLTANATGVAPSWKAVSGGVTSVVGDSGTAIDGVTTSAGGTNITTSSTGSTLTINLDAAITGMTSIDMANTGRIGTATSAGNTALIQAYDVDGVAYVTFATLTANNTPTMDLDEAVTKSGQYIYRAAGTDVPVTDGGTGVSTLTDHGILLGSGTGAVTPTAVGASGELLIGATAADPSWLTAGTDTYVLTANGSGVAPSWESTPGGALSINAQTGTTYTLVLTDAQKLVTLTNAAAITMTVPPNSSVALGIGTQILLYQGGAGAVTVAAGSGVTINSPGSALDLYAQYSTALLLKIATDTWILAGDIV